MASSSNIGLARLPWGRLPRSPIAGVPSPLEVSFRDIMAEQQKESSQDVDFEEYIQTNYVTVDTDLDEKQQRQPSEDDSDTPSSPPAEEQEQIRDIPDIEKSFMQLEDLDTDLKLVMSFYEDQDFDDAAYELSEQELDGMPDDESDKYYEGLAKKLSTVVEIQNSSLSNANRGGRAGGSLQQKPLDPRSQAMLDKLRQKGVVRSAMSSSTYRVIHSGKPVTVFHATGGMLKRREDISLLASTNANVLKLRLPKECAIKVFKNTSETSCPSTVTGEVEEEQRQVEAKREMTYLNRMTRAGIPCPQVQILYGHILVTDFLGKDGTPAKKLKDAHDLTSSRSSLKTAYEQITTGMKTLFKTCHLVHGDLSEKNILWHKRQAYFVSVGHAVNSNRPAALELLYRDCLSVTEFFETKGKSGCRSPQQLFQWITGFDYSGQLLHETCGSDFAMV